MFKVLKQQYFSYLKNLDLIWRLGFYFFLLSSIYELFNQSKASFLGLALMLVIFRFNFLAKKRQLYSYWMTSFIIVVFLLFKILVSYFNEFDVLFYSYSFSLGCILLLAYELFNPLYFPILKWWEYDFRYKVEIKTFLIQKDEKIECRLFDVRREAFCLLSFKDLDIEEDVKLNYFQEGNNEIYGKIVTKRETHIGRPKIYGVKSKSSKDYKKLKRVWDQLK